MAGWPRGLTKEAAKALSPEERRKLWNRPKEVMPNNPARNERSEDNAQPASRPRLEARVKPASNATKYVAEWTKWAGNDWTGTNAEESTDEYNIPREQFPEGMDLQWWTREIYGQETKQRITQARRGGWKEVKDADYDNWHQRVLGGKYELDSDGNVIHKGLGLFARPQEISDKSRARDLQRAREQIQLKEQAFKGGEMNATGAGHPSATASNRITRTMER